MASLTYSAIASLDGYVEDPQGRFDWGAPDDEVLSFINELERPVGMYLYGRRMYETMRYWETAPVDESVPAALQDFTEIWQGAEKVVYSRTLDAVSSARTRIARGFDSQEIRHLKMTASRDLTVAGANLASQAIESGLVDEFQLFVVPVVVGGGKPWLPRRLRLNLELLDSRRFASGVVFLRYRPAHGGELSSPSEEV
ncbi:MAG: dihydrofolate reductase family protein [Streptosporangiaceae bacterium]